MEKPGNDVRLSPTIGTILIFFGFLSFFNAFRLNSNFIEDNVEEIQQLSSVILFSIFGAAMIIAGIILRSSKY